MSQPPVVNLEPPRALPVAALSFSSISLLRKCPEKWRRRYIERGYEPVSGHQVAGSAIHDAEAQHLFAVHCGEEPFTVERVLDEYAAAFDLRADGSDVNWFRQTRGELKDAGARALAVYHERVGVTIRPAEVERGFRLRWPGCDWEFTGFADVETEDGTVVDLKTTSRPKTVSDVAVQAGMYLAARRAERREQHHRFRADVMQLPGKTTPPKVTQLPVTVSDAWLDSSERLIVNAAREIAWRAENDIWTGAPDGAWWCSDRWCGYWRSCPLAAGAAERTC